MKYCATLVLTSLLLFSGRDNASAQYFAYQIGYFGFFDNREYFNPYTNDQTIFGSRIKGELGYAFNNQNRIMAGADFLYEFGSKGEWIAPDVIVYYTGKYRHFDLSLGAFPRINKINMPLALMTDTFRYYRPNVEGILLEYNRPRFRHNLWIDWTGRQSYEKREAFMLGFTGMVSRGLLFYQHHLVMTHLAHSLEPPPEEHIRDNAGYSVLPGLNLTDITGLDSLTLSAGVLGSYDRIRSEYDFRFPFGFLAEMNVNYKGFGLHATVYTGDSQTIISGDGFYKSTFYSRADVCYHLFLPYLEGSVACSFHFLPEAVDLSMTLLIRAKLDGLFGNHHPN